MNKKLPSWHYAALFTLLLFGFTTNAQQRLGSAKNNHETVTRTAITQAETSQESNAMKAVEQSPLEAVKGKLENFSKRDAYSKHYINEDGSYTALIGSGPIHYEKNGNFLDIDHSITRQIDPDFSYANTSNLFESFFGSTASNGVKSKTAEGEVTEFLNTKMYWEVNGREVGTIRSSNANLSVVGEKAYYNNLYGSISAEFAVSTGKRELNYIIPNRQALGSIPVNASFLVFTEDIRLPEGWNSTITKAGVLITNRAGKEIYLYENPISTDAANGLSREENTIFETLLVENILTIKTKVKTDWLFNNNRQFPLKVDPTVSVYPNETTHRTGQAFATGGGYGNMAVGYAGGYYRGFATFDTNSILDGSTITSTTLNHFVGTSVAMGSGRGSEIRAYLGLPQDQGNFPNIYNAITNPTISPSIYQTVTNLGSTGWKNVTLGATANTHLQNRLNVNNFTIGYRPSGTYAGGSTQQYALIYGTPDPGGLGREPYLSVTYTEPITDRTLTVSGAYTGASYADGSHTFTNNTSITATSGTRPGYQVTGWTGTGSVPATGSTGSSTFTITQNSSIAWQWQQTGTPNSVVFHNYGGTEQLAFNNSRIATNTPVFRLSHSAYDANAYEVQINTSPTFGGGGFSQEFNVANPINTETNVTFNNGFSPTDGTTYYVRSRVKGAAEVWSAWTTNTYSFTYLSTQTTPDWFQTTQAQFTTDGLNGVMANVTGDVVTGAGGNRVANGSFESNINGWTVTKPSYFTVASEPYGNTQGSNALNIYNSNPGSFGNFPGDNAGVYQTVNMTGVSSLTADFGYEGTSGSSLNVNIEVYISETNETSLRSGVKILDWRPTSYETTENQFTIDLNSYGFTGNKLVKIVAYYAISSTDYAERYFYIDNVQLLFPPAGNINSTPIHLESVQGAIAYESITWDQTLNGGNLTLKVQGSTDGVSFSDITGYTSISEVGDGIKSFDLSGLETPPAHIRLVGTLDGAGVAMHDWSIQFAGLPEPTYDFTYLNDTEQWTPNYPGDTGNPSNATNSIGILEGTAVFNTDIIGGTLTVNENAKLEVENILKLHGDIINNGLITFKSSSIENTAQFDEFNGIVSGNGEFNTERFIPARRAYRFLSPSVTTSGNIYENWQENGDNTSGWGSHITGNDGATNGFDPTATNNPSMFVVATTPITQTWVSILNTNVNTLSAGIPYLLMVRGDRTIDLGINNPDPTDTVLRATGALATGDQTFTEEGLEENQNFFIGNPYQATVDIQQLINDAEGINPNFFYFYDSSLAGELGRGSYVVVDMEFGSGEATPESETNGYLQPGQAIMFHSTGEGATSVVFKEAYKAVDQPLTNIFRSTNTRLALQLFYADAFANGETPTDGISIKFSENGHNGIDAFDAPKMGNFDENFATLNGDKQYTIESRAYPENEEVIPLSINTYRKTNYVFEAKITNAQEQTTIYLYDNYTNTSTELSSEEATSYSFEVNPQIEESKSSSRFELRFEVTALNIDSMAMSTVAVYPNPFKGNSFNISARGHEGKSLDIQLVNMLGQSVYKGAVNVSSNGEATVTLSENVSSGIYNVNIVSEDKQSVNKKLIKN